MSNGTSAMAPPVRNPVTTEGARQKLGRLLIERGALSEGQLSEALEAQKRFNPRRRLGETLCELGLVTEIQVTSTLSIQLQVPYLEVLQSAIPSDILELVPMAVADRHQVIPVGFDRDGSLVLAMSDPTNLIAVDDVRMASNKKVVRIAAPPSQVRGAIDRGYRGSSGRHEIPELLPDVEAEDGAWQVFMDSVMTPEPRHRGTLSV